MTSRLSKQRQFSFFVVALLSFCSSPIFASDHPADYPTQIHLASFEFQAYSRQEVGSVLWLVGPDGDLRLEIRRGGVAASTDLALSRILDQTGHGWTAVLNGVADETINRWGEGWEFPPPGLGATVATMASELQVGPMGDAVSKRPWRAGAPSRESHRMAVASLVPEGDVPDTFRSQQAARGFGRGGSGDLLHWHWDAAAEESSPTLNLTASKWPGVLKMRLEDSYDGVIALPEVFVPLWPLRDLVTIVPAE